MCSIMGIIEEFWFRSLKSTRIETFSMVHTIAVKHAGEKLWYSKLFLPELTIAMSYSDKIFRE